MRLRGTPDRGLKIGTVRPKFGRMATLTRRKASLPCKVFFNQHSSVLKVNARC